MAKGQKDSVLRGGFFDNEPHPYGIRAIHNAQGLDGRPRRNGTKREAARVAKAVTEAQERVNQIVANHNHDTQKDG
jgi:hypothetical protein